MGRDGRGVKPISKSSIEITFIYKGKRCRERIPLPPTAANLKRAEHHRAAILYEISRGTFDYAQVFPNSPRAATTELAGQTAETVAAYLERWLEIKKTQIAASTHRSYHSIIFGQVIPRFGKMRLAELRRAHLKEWLATIDDQQKKKVTNKRLANIQSCLRSALSDAVADEILDVNPLAGFTFERNEAPREQDHADPLDADEQAAVIAAARDPQIANLFRFAFWTGMRTSELIALDWSDVDWQRGTVRVRKAMTRAAKGTAEDTKTLAGRRDVKLLGPALAALEAQKAHTLLANGAVFHNPGWRGGESGRWKGDDQIWEAWRTTLKRAGVRYRNPYQTRHTFASMMLSAGEHPMWVARQMGHSDTTSIMRNYGRWIPSSNPDAGGKAVAMFSAGDNGKLGKTG
ncbi:site-specific integrase [Caballeronia sp. AZ10_KS36]|uniref:site-specific integrase n=1 Tax=Caballeronia sp. AZ10_KS36 TaxID=2921757 RepID=UPI002027F9E8|nr:site-specific integrase [Caballeronia sp. AZ10_KS36]